MTKESTLSPVEGSRPEQPALRAVIAGATTEVGKTWATASAAVQLRRAGMVVAAGKPAQSHESGDVDTDVAVLANSTKERIPVVCRADREYPVAMTPPMTPSALGAPPFTVADLVAEIEWPRAGDAGLIESAGIHWPLTSDGDAVEPIGPVDAGAVVLDADVGFEVINAARLCLAALDPIRPIVVLDRLGSSNHLHCRNLPWRTGVDELGPLSPPEALAHHLAGPREDLR